MHGGPGDVRRTLRRSAPIPSASYTPASRSPIVTPRTRRHPSLVISPTKGEIMGKYFIAWILGVPAVVLVAVYFFTHM